MHSRGSLRRPGFVIASLALLTALIWTIGAAKASHGRVIYSTSFEAPRDTVGWCALGLLELVGERPPGGGRQTLSVSGGCLIPHASHTIPATRENRRLVLRALAKFVRGGSVELGVEGHPSIYVPVSLKEWQSEDTLFCPAGVAPRIRIMGGGIIQGGILVERIEVVQVP